MNVLRVDEWMTPSGQWYVADVKTWTGWRAMADVLGAESLEEFKELLRDKYGAEEVSYTLYSNGSDLLRFWSYDYKKIHQLKLDVNRIARKTNYMVELPVWYRGSDRL